MTIRKDKMERMVRTLTNKSVTISESLDQATISMIAKANGKEAVCLKFSPISGSVVKKSELTKSLKASLASAMTKDVVIFIEGIENVPFGEMNLRPILDSRKSLIVSDDETVQAHNGLRIVFHGNGKLSPATRKLVMGV